MRLGYPHRSERFGAIRIHGLQQVVELDSGARDDADPAAKPDGAVQYVSSQDLSDIEKRMAIVVPCKDEKRKVIDGVLSGIPHNCLIILVSNSEREPVDRFEMERRTVDDFCRFAERSAVVAHQRDPGIAEAFKATGFTDILDDDGLVRNGKGEGMMVGMMLASLAGRDHVGYIDADNFVPGAVHEYVKAYGSGLLLAESPFSMVRISWMSKPKIQDGRLRFNRWGRTSQITNEFLNLLLAEYSGFGTDIIVTGNAGEHAMSLALGMRMQMASGFAVEPHQYIDLFEQFSGILPSGAEDVLKAGVDILQIETRNPHFHEDKGADHVQEMRLNALNVLFHSPVCLKQVQKDIKRFLREQKVIGKGEAPPRERIYPALETIDQPVFLSALEEHGRSFQQIRRRRLAGIVEEAPITPDAAEAAAAPENA